MDPAEEVRTGDRVTSSYETFSLVMKSKFTIPFMALMCVFALVYVFVTQDDYHAAPFAHRLYLIILADRFPPHGNAVLSIFDIIVFLLSMAFIYKFGLVFWRTHLVLKLLFAYSVVWFVLNTINPNNQPSGLGWPISVDFEFLTYLSFLLAVCFLREGGFIALSRRFFTLICGFVVGRSFLLLVLWGMGKGSTAFFGQNATLTEGDNLLVFAFVQAVVFALYLQRRTRILLLSWVILFLVQLLSFRRTGLFIALATNFITLALHGMLNWRAVQLVQVVLKAVGIGLALCLVIAITVPRQEVERYALRYAGMFLGVGEVGGEMAYATDSGHFDESSETLAYAFERMEFWGYGYGKSDRLNIPVATKGRWVHNVYSGAWLYEGFHAFLFFVVLFILVVGTAVRLFLRRWLYEPSYVVLVLTLMVFLMMLMVAWWANPLALAHTLKMSILWVLPIAFVFKVQPENFPFLGLDMERKS
jgi:hypothetical protein